MRSLALIATLLIAAPALAGAQTLRTITVSGEAEVLAVPDMATVSIGATSRSDTALAAMNATSEALEAVIARLETVGIKDRDIQTSSLNINERLRYDQERGAEVSEGFEARNQLNVRVRDLDRLGAILGAVLEDGVNSLSGLSFGLQDPKPLEDEARRLAVRDALDKAALYTGAAGVGLGQVLSISDSAAPMVNNRGFSEPKMLEAAARDVPIAAGEVSARAQVTIVLQIAD